MAVRKDMARTSIATLMLATGVAVASVWLLLRLMVARRESPAAARLDHHLDEALEESFPASDPVSVLID